MKTASRFQLFSIITKCICSFLDSNIRKQIVSVEKELQHAKKDNATLARYINARRKKEEAWKKAMVVVPMSDEGRSSKDVQTYMK
jgi:hypothetical protein